MSSIPNWRHVLCVSLMFYIALLMYMYKHCLTGCVTTGANTSSLHAERQAVVAANPARTHPAASCSSNNALIENLQQEIELLKLRLLEKDAQFVKLNATQIVQDDDDGELKQFLLNKVHSSTGIGVGVTSEYDMIPFRSFTTQRIYQIESGVRKLPDLKPGGDRKLELNEVVHAAVSSLNRESAMGSSPSPSRFSTDDLTEGLYRTDAVIGTQYEMVFGTNQRDVYRLVKMVRPFGPLHRLETSTLDTTGERVHIIVPLSGRLESFQSFVSRFMKSCVETRENVFLSVVYFGSDGADEVEEILADLEGRFNFTSYSLTSADRPFSRGAALNLGSRHVAPGLDPILFFCDVDIDFMTDFLQRCRFNTQRATQVFYPIVFSLYNPAYVQGGASVGHLPPTHGGTFATAQSPSVIGKEKGFWRAFGYGMACVYKSDFDRVGGFDENIKGWGSEDVKLYESFTRGSQVKVIRSPDRGLFHIYHQKHCNSTLPRSQYVSCMRSRALTEASHEQLGLLAFRQGTT